MGLQYPKRWLCACVPILWVVVAAASTTPCSAQVLRGQWVDDADAAIEKHRKTDLTVIVLDQKDRAVLGATVQAQQTRHDFVLGLTLPINRQPPGDLAKRPVYRCINAVSLDRLTDWSANTPTQANPASHIRNWQQAVKPIRTAFGRVISADPARNDDDLLLLDAKQIQQVLNARIDYATGFAPKPDTYDLYGDLIYQDLVERKLGPGMIHRMFDRAASARPNAQLSLRVHDAITMHRGREMAAVVQRMEVRQVGFDSVTIEQRFNDQLNPIAMSRMLGDYVGKLPVPATFARLEVGGASPVAAGLNMETVLRLLFANPKVDGLYLSGLYEDELLEEHAALIDQDGELTAAGLALDTLFRETWWSNEQATTDERGNAEMRVFTGWYIVTAALPDGTTMTTRVHIPKGDRTRLVVLQVIASDAADD